MTTTAAAHQTATPQAASLQRSAATRAPHAAGPAHLAIGRIQQAAGNRTMHRLLRAPGSIQRKPPPPPPVETIASETVETAPAPRTRTKIGVGEEVTLTHAPGSAAWATTGGKLSAAKGVTVVLTAPDTAQTVTVTAGAARIAFTIVAPDNVLMEQVAGTGVAHTKGRPDSGIGTQPFLLPDTVNFSNVIYRELNVAATVTKGGVYSCFAGVGHCKQPAGGACRDNPMTATVVAGKGTRTKLQDCVYSGDCATTAPFMPGLISFEIPWEYKVGAGAYHSIRKVFQFSMLLYPASLMSGKAGASGTTSVGSPTVTVPNCP